jgi:hypothetical protein
MLLMVYPEPSGFVQVSVSQFEKETARSHQPMPTSNPVEQWWPPKVLPSTGGAPTIDSDAGPKPRGTGRCAAEATRPDAGRLLSRPTR